MTEDVNPPSAEELKALGIDIPAKGKVVVDVFTTWCGPCKQVKPILHKMEEDGEIALVPIDLDKNEELGKNHNIHAVPTLIFFKDGKRIGSISKGEPKEVPLADLLEQVLGGSYEYKVLQNKKPLADIGSLNVTLTRTLVKDGVMVGFCGEEFLREVIDQM